MWLWIIWETEKYVEYLSAIVQSSVTALMCYSPFHLFIIIITTYMLFSIEHTHVDV